MPAPALTAFLRGIERRGVVFAQLQGGDADRGEAALAAAMRVFAQDAGQWPVAQWPDRFWTLLLAEPGMRGHGAPARWPPVFEHLADLGHGPRAALLLRLVAGLPEVTAASVLGIARGTYRLALQRALPHGEDGTPDPARWQALGDAAQLAVRQVSGERVARIREAGERPAGSRPPRHASPTGASGLRAAPWRLPALAVVGVLTLGLLVASFRLPDEGGGLDTRDIRIRALPAAAAPAATFDEHTALLTHRDFDLLAQAADAGPPAGTDPAFLAWLAARAEQGRAGDEARPLPLADALVPLADDAAQALEGGDAP